MRAFPSILLLLAAPAAELFPQAQPPPTLDWSADDSARIEFLGTHGHTYRRGPIIVWAPADSLDSLWLDAFADSLAGGVAMLRDLIGGPYAWQRIGDRPVTFYLGPGRFVSHATGRGAVLISLTRVRQANAPFLHEAAHELLAPWPPFYPVDKYPDAASEAAAESWFPLWLAEGVPDYLAQTVSAATGLHEGDVFEIGGLGKVDSVCASRLSASPWQAEILAKVGRVGRVEALFTPQRAEVAPVFYACSQSLTQYLVRRIGIAATVALFPGIPSDTWRTALAAAAGMPLEVIRQGWLASLGLADAPGH